MYWSTIENQREIIKEKEATIDVLKAQLDDVTGNNPEDWGDSGAYNNRGESDELEDWGPDLIPDSMYDLTSENEVGVYRIGDR